MKKLNKIICFFKGHTDFDKNTGYTKLYIRRGKKFVLKGLLYKCKRCGTKLFFEEISLLEFSQIVDYALKKLKTTGINSKYQSYDYFNHFWKSKGEE